MSHAGRVQGWGMARQRCGYLILLFDDFKPPKGLQLFFTIIILWWQPGPTALPDLHQRSTIKVLTARMQLGYKGLLQIKTINLTVAISAQYIVAKVNNIPRAIPHKILPAYIIATLTVVTIRIHPISKGMAQLIRPHLRPIVDAAKPPMKGPVKVLCNNN